jgi:hypothetical protein
MPRDLPSGGKKTAAAFEQKHQSSAGRGAVPFCNGAQQSTSGLVHLHLPTPVSENYS